MFPLQRPRPCSPADTGIILQVSVPCKHRYVRGGGGGGREFKKCKNLTLLYQTISHTFCP
ncbi:unnamed protein product [Staurois parvus]|uniref:Uncharacterized protein n=1 Tax=Staurois parvus TaxID=386267 RepID=A0ABN9F3W7_9NEOB|nr:unnamed protein product [Staurois parvus]